MKNTVRWRKHILQFKFDAGTSRGVLKEKPTYFVQISTDKGVGVGECSPLVKLSIDDRPDYEQYLTKFCLLAQNITAIEEIYEMPQIEAFPSIIMGLETAWYDAQNGGKHLIFESSFYNQKPIPINGLIWMGNRDFMLAQIEKKIDEGFRCLKLKIGVDFQMECQILAYIRQQFSPAELEIRVDANGAFPDDKALYYLEKLVPFHLHSIEQPIRAGNWAIMKELCRNTPIPIALDEELIGIYHKEDKQNLLQTIKPQYIILKPSLIGGFRATAEWIELAHQYHIPWWITSALESNIGLNAICQFTAQYPITLPQGLGTGQLYHNNIASPLKIEKACIAYDHRQAWENISI